jgi:hypothetical protein
MLAGKEEAYAYNGSKDVEIAITPGNIGAATSSHSHQTATSSSAGFMSSSDKSTLDKLNSNLGISSYKPSSLTNGSINTAYPLIVYKIGKLVHMEGTINFSTSVNYDTDVALFTLQSGYIPSKEKQSSSQISNASRLSIGECCIKVGTDGKVVLHQYGTNKVDWVNINFTYVLS